MWDRLARERTPVVVTDWVVAETGNGLARFPVRDNFRRAVDLIETSPRATWLTIDKTLVHQALRLYGERSDKTWGLVDCASFVIMERSPSCFHGRSPLRAGRVPAALGIGLTELLCHVGLRHRGLDNACDRS